MKDFLMNCFYDGISLESAIKMAESCYGKKVSERTIKTVKSEIKDFSNKDWK
jgi:hypothetical protein